MLGRTEFEAVFPPPTLLIVWDSINNTYISKYTGNSGAKLAEAYNRALNVWCVAKAEEAARINSLQSTIRELTRQMGELRTALVSVTLDYEGALNAREFPASARSQIARARTAASLVPAGWSVDPSQAPDPSIPPQ